jgi:hypothetical protein
MDSDLHRYLFAACFAKEHGRSPVLRALSHHWITAVLATALLGVIAGVEAAYFSTEPVEKTTKK